MVQQIFEEIIIMWYALQTYIFHICPLGISALKGWFPQSALCAFLG